MYDNTITVELDLKSMDSAGLVIHYDDRKLQIVMPAKPLPNMGELANEMVNLGLHSVDVDVLIEELSVGIAKRILLKHFR